MSINNLVINFFYKKSWLSFFLKPISITISCLLTIIYFFRKTHQIPIPSIIVGNITVGGTGKTPCIIWLYLSLKESGWSPAILTRGYLGKLKNYPYLVNDTHTVEETGDEAFMLYKRLNAPIWIDPNRKRSALKAIEKGANILLLDDGLQSTRFSNAITFCLIDTNRYFGNELIIPFGPLRESLNRLNHIDFILLKKSYYPKEYFGNQSDLLSKKGISFQYKPIFFQNAFSDRQIKYDEFPFNTFNALCGIGNASYFFDLLSKKGKILEKIILPDHANITEKNSNQITRISFNCYGKRLL